MNKTRKLCNFSLDILKENWLNLKDKKFERAEKSAALIPVLNAIFFENQEQMRVREKHTKILKFWEGVSISY